MMGHVTLVGAGPGDPGLLTLKGKKAIERADVVVFDRLVSRSILALIPPTAKAIDVGKRVNVHPVPQEEINQILLREALGGANVVRLKGGDPFLFGRGGEELELLAQHQVPFQVVPGVTSALAVPAYGGIPVTHRDCCSSLHIVTGHQRAGKALDIDFDALVATRGTLVFLMGVSALPQICEGLLKAGMDPHTPAAIVERGTTPAQRRISATLSTLAQAAQDHQVVSPAISVVGGVCALADSFDWFDALPLKGRTFVVTRPAARKGTLAQGLRELGAKVWEYPCIRTTPITPCPPLTAALERLGNYQWIAFTSPVGVGVFFDALHGQGKDSRALAGVKLAAIGPGTAAALKKYGLTADYVPAVYSAQDLGQGIPATGTVLLPRAQEGSPLLTQALTERGIPYEELAVYTTHYDNPRSPELREALEAGQLSYVTFTSASTVKGFVASVGEDAPLGNITGLCIGHQTAQEAMRHGIPVLIAEEATIPGLLRLAQTL